jgi:hypothetical protein
MLLLRTVHTPISKLQLICSWVTSLQVSTFWLMAQV